MLDPLCLPSACRRRDDTSAFSSAGVVCACLLFVISYARLGVVRRHLIRAQFSSRVDRSAEASAYLRTVGDARQDLVQELTPSAPQYPR